MENAVTIKMGLLPEDINKNILKKNTKHGFKFIPNKAFKDYADEHNDIKVSGYSMLKTAKENDDNINRLYLVNEDGKNQYFKFELLKSYENIKPFYKVTGYTMLEDNSYIALVIPVYPFFFLFLLLLCILLMFLCSNKSHTYTNESGLTFEEDHEIEEPEEREGYTETIDIPGYSNIVLNEQKREIQLINPEGNSVYFVYVLTENGEVLYETKAIKPGNSVMADLYSVLDNGTHIVNISVATYDVNTEESCNGTSQSIKLTIKDKD